MATPLNAQQRMNRNDLVQSRLGYQPAQGSALSTQPTQKNAQTRMAANDFQQQKLGYLPPPISTIGNRPNTALVGQKAAAPSDGLKKPDSTLPSQFKQKTTGTESADLSSGLISSAPLQGSQSNNQNGANASLNNSGSQNPTVQNQPSQPYAGIVGRLIQQSSQPGQAYQDAQQQVAQKNQELGNLRAQEAQALYGNANPANGYGRSIEYQQGTGSVLQNLYANLQNAKAQELGVAQQQVGAANTQQQLQQSGLTSAAGFAQPVGQFGLLTNPLTGQPINTNILQGVVSQAQQLVNSGVPVTDPSVQNLLNPLGLFGASAFTQAQQMLSGGNWNPAAQSSAAGQNISFQQQTQNQAQNLGLALNQLNAFQPKVLDFLNNSPLNPSGMPIWNEQISKYLADIKNPAVSNQWNSIVNDIQGIAQQIIASKTPGTPTSTTEMAAAQNPSSLTGAQLKSVLDTWDTLGKTTLGAYQSTFNQAGGSNNAYLGGSSATNAKITPAPSNPGGFEDSTSQGIGGVLLNIGTGLVDLKNWGAALLGHIL